ncbi:MAG: TIGR04283 family arsenosugar biosynthesis glycosyltransferase [Acidiferrobacterales bacterium]
MSTECGNCPPPSVAAVVPALNEAAGIAERVEDLLRSGFAQVIVVDGGSNDATFERAQAVADSRPGDPQAASRLTVLRAACGRAIQMNRGAQAAGADVLLFVHADTRLPPGAVEMVRKAICRGGEWGRFDMRLDGPQRLLRLIERAMNMRSALTGIATGDQALFVRRDVFTMLRGFAQIPLMEDIEISRRLRMLARPVRIRAPVLSAARRWQHGGVARTMLLMWCLRFLYWLGVAPARFARLYRNVR